MLQKEDLVPLEDSSEFQVTPVCTGQFGPPIQQQFAQTMANHNPSVSTVHDQQPPFPINAVASPFVQVSPPAVGPTSIKINCPHCRCLVNTDVSYRSTAMTHLACLLLTSCCCCCLPYCMKSCQNANHFCPMCRTYIGTYRS